MILPGERLGCLRVMGYHVRETAPAPVEGNAEASALPVLVFGLALRHADGRELHHSIRLRRHPGAKLSVYDLADNLLRVATEQIEHGLATGHDPKACEAQGCPGPWPKWEA